MDGSSGIGVAGCGVYAIHLVLLGLVECGVTWICFLHCLDGAGEACRLYCSIPGPLQTVQRAEIWGVLVALQRCVRAHMVWITLTWLIMSLVLLL